MNKPTNSMKKVLWILFAVIGMNVSLMAQTGNVGVNTDEPKTTLQINGDAATNTHRDGVLLPRLTGDQLHAKDFTKDGAGAAYDFSGTIVYVTAAASAANQANTEQTEYVTAPGFYFFDANVKTNGRWVGLSAKAAQANSTWFYMPSIKVPLDGSEGTAANPLDLYAKYKSQFENPLVSSVAGAKIPFLAQASDIIYFITDYDTSLLTGVNITADGKMTYTVNGSATGCSFINIVFVIK